MPGSRLERAHCPCMMGIPGSDTRMVRSFSGEEDRSGLLQADRERRPVRLRYPFIDTTGLRITLHFIKSELLKGSASLQKSHKTFIAEPCPRGPNAELSQPLPSLSNSFTERVIKPNKVNRKLLERGIFSKIVEEQCKGPSAFLRESGKPKRCEANVAQQR